MTVPIIRSRAELRALIASWKAAGETVGVVPTMGALHAGHLSLVRAAKADDDRVVVTLFVNPRQFNNAADFDAYPRTETSDAEKLAPFAVDALYVPDGAEMYPDGFSTTVSVAGVSEGLCGGHRPGHFDGVATIVTKLLLQTSADRAYFGEKDWQQLQVVRRLVADLDIACEIVACPTVREPDALALSSRNLRLSEAERAAAPALAKALHAAAGAIAAGAPVAPTLDAARDAILAAGFREVEYLEIRDEADLARTATPGLPARLLVAAWLGDIRLIDNVPLPPATEAG